jgi:hypothetical protein
MFCVEPKLRNNDDFCFLFYICMNDLFVFAKCNIRYIIIQVMRLNLMLIPKVSFTFFWLGNGSNGHSEGKGFNL